MLLEDNSCNLCDDFGSGHLVSVDALVSVISVIEMGLEGFDKSRLARALCAYYVDISRLFVVIHHAS